MDWTGHPRRLAQLYVGLWLYGFGAALQVRAGLGLDPWDVFHQGLSHHVGLAIGTVLIAVGALVLLLWIPLRQRPGLGTVSNVILIGVSLNVSLEWLPNLHGVALRIAGLALGIVLGGVATGMYIGAHYGPGPRDGLMTGLARRTGRSIRLVRTGLEVTVLIAGWALGGTVGVGTVAYALAIGPLAQIFLPIFDVRPAQVTSRQRASASANMPNAAMPIAAATSTTRPNGA
ncbi:MAG: YczE/YyaS/YitT family protein [Jatrophihabitantaceae bacterium]